MVQTSPLCLLFSVLWQTKLSVDSVLRTSYRIVQTLLSLHGAYVELNKTWFYINSIFSVLDTLAWKNECQPRVDGSNQKLGNVICNIVDQIRFH